MSQAGAALHILTLSLFAPTHIRIHPPPVHPFPLTRRSSELQWGVGEKGGFPLGPERSGLPGSRRAAGKGPRVESREREETAVEAEGGGAAEAHTSLGLLCSSPPLAGASLPYTYYIDTIAAPESREPAVLYFI